MSDEDAVERTAAAWFDRHVIKPADPAERERAAWAFLREHYPRDG